MTIYKMTKINISDNQLKELPMSKAGTIWATK